MLLKVDIFLKQFINPLKCDVYVMQIQWTTSNEAVHVMYILSKFKQCNIAPLIKSSLRETQDYNICLLTNGFLHKTIQ